MQMDQLKISKDSHILPSFRDIAELGSFYPTEGLMKLLHDKFLRQQLENVGGYVVPRTLAPVLGTLLRNYQDLGRGEWFSYSNITPTMKSVVVTLVCIVIERICKTDAEDIKKDDVKTLDILPTKHWRIYELRNYKSFI